MDKKLFTLEEAKDKILGKIGTKRRDRYESELSQELNNIACEHPKEKVIGWHDSSMLCTNCNSIVEQYGEKIDPPCKL